jgi:hypothetical protein
LGFVHTTTLKENTTTPTGAPRDTEVWMMSRSAYSAVAEKLAAPMR